MLETGEQLTGDVLVIATDDVTAVPLARGAREREPLSSGLDDALFRCPGCSATRTRG